MNNGHAVSSAILDGDFIISCRKKGIDPISQLRAMGFRVIIPRESLQDVKDQMKDSSSRLNRELMRETLLLYSDKNVEVKTIGKQGLGQWLLKKGSEGFYIGTKIKNVFNRVLRRIIVLEGEKKVAPFEGNYSSL